MLITTLPVTPKVTASFTTLLAPLIASIVARSLGVQMIMANNLTGLRFSNRSKDEVCEIDHWYHSSLKRIGINDYDKWSDVDPEYEGFLSSSVKGLMKKGFLREADIEVLRCHCGMVDIPESALATAMYSGKRLFKPESGNIVCNACGLPAVKVRARALVLKLPSDSSPPPVCIPTVFEHEVGKVFENLAGREMIVSRLRQTHFNLEIGDNRYNLDIDFSWAFYLAYFQSKRREKMVVVCSNRVFLPLAQAILLSSLVVDLLDIQVLVYPIMHLVSKRGTTNGEWTIDEFLDSAEGFPARCLLVDALHWNHKDVRVDSEILYHAKLCSRKLPRAMRQVTAATSVHDFVSACNGMRLRGLLSKIKKGAALDSQEELLLSVLT